MLFRSVWTLGGWGDEEVNVMGRDSSQRAVLSFCLTAERSMGSKITAQLKHAVTDGRASRTQLEGGVSRAGGLR